MNVQLHTVELKMAAPNPTLDNATPQFAPHEKLKTVPRIQIFGRLTTGESACINIHNVYPYFYCDIPVRENCPLEGAHK